MHITREEEKDHLMIMMMMMMTMMMMEEMTFRFHKMTLEKSFSSQTIL